MTNLPPTLAICADSAFVTGRSHIDRGLPCQDYALAGVEAGPGLGLGWAVVSDGCSTGGKTDVGARMWAHAAQRVLRRDGLAALDDIERLSQSVLEIAGPLLDNFDNDDGYATLMLLASDGLRARAVVYGDGVVVALKRDGRVCFWGIHCTSNAPRYLNYTRDPKAETLWERAWGQGEHRVYYNEYRYEPDMGAELLATHATCAPAAEVRAQVIDIDDVPGTLGLFICSDGALTFPGATPIQALLPLTAVQNPTGAFIQRRLAALSRKWAKTGDGAPVDDLAVAALWLL